MSLLCSSARAKLLFSNINKNNYIGKNCRDFGKFSPSKIGIIGAPFDRGQPKSGVEDGPKACRDSGFINVLKDALNLDVKDYGDLDFGLLPRNSTAQTKSNTNSVPVKDRQNVEPKNVADVAKANKITSSMVSQVLKDNRLCLTLGGDHSLGTGTVDGTATVYGDIGVLWVDAHADINTISTSLTGNMHGMPLSFVIKELQPFMRKLPEFSWLTPKISASNVAYIGLRDVDFSEKLIGQYNRSIINELGITAFSMKEVDEYGISNVLQMALDKISPRGCRPIHLSFDIDSLDDTDVRSTGTAVPGGLTLREGLTLLEGIHKSGLMVGMDFVEFNPHLGSSSDVERAKNVTRHLLSAAFGYYRGGVSRGKISPI